MTNDQRQAIKEVAHLAWFNGNVDDAVLAGIEKYDELVNKELAVSVRSCVSQILKFVFAQSHADFKNIIPDIEVPKTENIPPDSMPESENVIFFKEKNNDEIRIFDSLPQLINKLSDEYHCSIAIRDDFTRHKDQWPDPHPLMKVHLDNDGIFHIDDFIGFYGLQSVRKG